MTSKYEHLLKDADVRRWFENLKVSSIITATVYLRTLGLYCEMEKTTPQRLIKEADTKEFIDRFFDFVREMESKGKAGSYITRFKKVLLSWLSHNRIDLKIKVKIKGAKDRPTVEDEGVPSDKDLDKIIRMASPRARVSIALMAFSGLRPESIGNYDGTDGLTFGDLREAKISENNITFDNAEPRLEIRSTLSKDRQRYFVFIAPQGLTYLQDYLNQRTQAGEILTSETQLIAFDPRGQQRNRFLRTSLVTRDIKEAILKAGYRWRPYVLRSYCATGYDRAEDKGLISHNLRKFLMGHKGDIEALYSTNKRLSSDRIDEIRDAYRRCLPFLQTVKSESSEDQIKRELKRQFLIIAGFSEEEVDKMDLETMTSEEIQMKVKERLLGAMVNNGAKQRVIPIKEVEKMVVQGWEYVAPLPEDKAIMKLPI